LVSPVDIILDGLLGYEFMLHEVTVDHERVLIADLIDWANANKAPVLSLELASGACNTAGKYYFTLLTLSPPSNNF
jgi:NAD(P)H-hydrate repair Nnr-like enzyme with NAD(P)H-hydrate epimerase domain